MYQIKQERGPSNDSTSTGVIMKLRDTDVMKSLEVLGKYGNHTDLAFRSSIQTFLFKQFNECSDNQALGRIIINDMKFYLEKLKNTTENQMTKSNDLTWHPMVQELQELLKTLKLYSETFYDNKVIKLVKDARAEVFSNWRRLIEHKPRKILLNSLDSFEVNSNIFSKSNLINYYNPSNKRMKTSTDASIFGIKSL